MRLFGRGRTSIAAIGDFWRWWPQAREGAEKCVETGEWDEAFIRDVGTKVAAIHPDLEWEFVTGSTARHALVVCCGGGPALRATAERWRAAAPAADAAWEFHSTRQPDPNWHNRVLTIDGHEVELGDLRFALHLDLERAEVDVTAYHPLFAALAERSRLRVTFLALDWALGEAGVGLWLGAVDTATTPPERPQTVRGLRAAVAELDDRHDDQRWAVLGGQDSRGIPMIASVQVPLKSARWPRFDTHVAVVLPYRHRLENGLPDDSSLTALRAFEDQVIASLRGDGQLVAHESRHGRRTLHVYVDGTTAARAVVSGLLAFWVEGRATATAKPDPTWKGISHLRA